MRIAKFDRCSLRLLAFAFLLILFGALTPHTQGQSLPVDATQLKGNETDPSIAIDSLSSNELCVAAQIDGTVPGLCVAISTNLGQSWTTNIIATNNDASGLAPAYGEPSVAWDSYGNLFLAYLPATFEGIAIAVSTNGGANFTALTNLVALHSTDQPRLTTPIGGSGAGSLWVVYKDYTLPNTPLVVQGLQSTGLGTNGAFGPPEILPNMVDQGSQTIDGGFADISVGPLGQVMVVYQDNLDDAGPANIYVSVNTNAVLTFPTNDAHLSLTVVESDGQPFIALEGTLPGYSYEILTNGSLTAPDWGALQTVVASNGLTLASPLNESGGPLYYSAELVGTPAINLFSTGFSPPTIVAQNALGGFTYVTNAVLSGTGINAAPGVAWDVDPYSETFGQAYVDYTGFGSATNPIIELAISADRGVTWSAPAEVDGDTGGNAHFLPHMAVDPLTGIVGLAWLDCRNDTGSGSAEETVNSTSTVVISNFVVTNISIVNLIPNVTDPAPTLGNGNNLTIGVLGQNMYGVLVSSTNTSTNTIIYIHGSTTNIEIYLTGTNTTPGPPVTNTSVTLNITSMFPGTYTTGEGNQEAVIYSTLSTNGGAAFAMPTAVVNLNTPINSPATGLSSIVAGSTGLTGWGNYTGMTGYGGTFYFAWPDNSDITTNNPDGAGLNFDVYVASTAVATADLVVTVTNSPNPVLSEGVLIYTVTVSNNGPTATGPITVSDTLSTNVTLESVIPALGGTYSVNGSNITLTFPQTLAVAGSLVSTIRVAATRSAVDTNIAIVSGPLTDLVPTNNTNVLVLTIAGQDLALNMSTSASNLFVGQTVTNLIVVTNLGPAMNEAVFVTNILSSDWGSVTVQTPGTYTVTNNTIVIDLGLLPVNEAVTSVVTAVALSTGETLATNSAVVASLDVDTNLANNSTNIISTIYDEDLGITMSASATNVPLGQPVTFTLTVTNLGPSTGGLATVIDKLSTNLGQIVVSQSQGTYTTNNNEVIFSLGELTTNQIATMTISAVPLSLPLLASNTASVSSSIFDTNGANNSASAIISLQGEDLSLAMTTSTGWQVGQVVTYTNLVTNLGPATNATVLLTNTFSARLQAVGVQAPFTNFTLTNNTLIVNLGTVGLNQTVPVVVMANALAAGNATNSGGIHSSYFDTNLVNNTNREVVTIIPALPMISNVVVTALASSAFISWNTGNFATGQVQYGLTTSYGSLSSLNSMVSTQHVVLLTGLVRDTNYNFQIKSQVGSTLYTTNGSFATVDTLILNTGDASYTGVWTGTSAGSNIYGNLLGTYYQITEATNSNPTAYATYSPNIPAAGDYNVSVWYPTSTNFTTNAQMYVFGATNEVIDSVNQTIHGGSWQPLAADLYFARGTGGHVIIYNDTGETTTFVAANAMKWSYDIAQDSPSDGSVPAWWSTYYFGTNSTVSGSADSDGSGYSNYADYVLGLAPNNPNSSLIFQVSQGASNSVNVMFSPYQGGRLYQLQAAACLASPQWVTLTNQVTTDTNGNGLFIVNQANATNSFYRLSATVAP
jgi:uncharacterized repeat protein (TIGR01451 family)